MVMMAQKAWEVVVHLINVIKLTPNSRKLSPARRLKVVRLDSVCSVFSLNSDSLNFIYLSLGVIKFRFGSGLI